MRIFWDLCWTGVAFALLAAAGRIVAHDGHLLLMWANSFSPYVYAPAILLLPLALWRGRRALAAACLLLIVCQAIWVWPDYLGRSDPVAVGSAETLRIFDANLYRLNQSPDGILAEITASNAQVVLLQEVTQRWVDLLRKEGLLDRYPHHVLRPRDDSFGMAVLSKKPFQEVRVDYPFEVPVISVGIDAGGRTVQIINWHCLSPSGQPQWDVIQNQCQHLLRWIEQEKGPLLVIGDFNATQHSYWLHRFQKAGLTSAHEQRGRGSAVTWPNGLNPLPPIRIDHALLSRHLRCVEISEGIGQGSDHKPLILDVIVQP